ncbi:MAG TPA: sigma-70 family RNA polymerase sigma factor [Sedimentisphaerales bacterium]|nr:sigma-70 family RNA polymerase sigma factor [Sedimentisphaerales bacterium]
MLEDRLLVWRFNRGDTDALRDIYEKYRDDLLKVAAALLNDKNGVEDVVHDVFASFAQTAGDFRQSGSLKAYLSICVANRARDGNRAILQRQTISLGRTEPVLPDRNRPDNSAMFDELSEQLARAISQLPYEQREVIILHLQSRMRFRQIAKGKGVSLNTILSRYRYGLNKLRSILDGE